MDRLFSLLFNVLSFGIVPGILWLRPGTRRRTGDWLVAWKTVPVGFIVFMLTTKIACYLTSPPSFLPQAFAGLVLAAAATVLLIRLTRRRYHAEKPFRVWPSLTVAGICLIGLVPLVWLELALRTFVFGYHPPGHAVPIPTEGAGPVTLEQRSIHPVRAEYDYRLAFPGKAETRRCFLFTGGYTDFLVFRLDDGRLVFFADHYRVHLVDARARKVFRLFRTEDRRILAAELPGGEAKVAYVLAGPDGRAVTVNGRPAVVDPGSLGETMRRLGRIHWYKFIPAEPEVTFPVSRLGDSLGAPVRQLE